ncbi:MAG: hypothetical protein J7647_24315 [Cyanobacteria bacterium SBLK]|nr:hypothetical protein [Cyanobacteria bacterium SBLK]
MENYQNLTRRDWQAIEIFPNHYLCPLFKSWHQAEYVVIYQARICLESPHVISIAVEYLGVWNERVFWELLAIERQKEQQKTLMREEKNHQIVKSMPTLLNALDTAQRVQFLVILLGVILAAIASL